jgi:hypothetical protein
MSQDHFIARTYLKHFVDPAKGGGMLHAYRKSDQTEFACRPADICREWRGDLNPEFITQRPALLGELRKIFEPHWNEAISKLRSKSVTAQDKFVISGYVANLLSTTPAWRRIGVKLFNEQLRGYLLFSKRMKEKHGRNEKLPVEAIAMMEQGRITINADPNAVKAVLTKQMVDIALGTYNQDWIILENDTAHPFITSDNPAAIAHRKFEPVQRYTPIDPQLCLFITYSRRPDRLTEATMSKAIRLPPTGQISYAKVSSKQARAINCLVAQCAEDLVLSSTQSTGIAKLVKKYARFCVDVEYREFPGQNEEAIYQAATIGITKRR